ncbi:MAG TPA: GyrI-like domain-containing protein [Magnetospirillaceae bacterium]|nr:GyrI-like domain-containing protein [Magnetospirillaceae bacterium]
MDKVDIKRQLKPLYAAPAGRFVLIDVPPLRYFMVDGAGDPNRVPAYRAAVEALYAVSYTLKFKSKRAGRDYVVPPLQGLWWADDMEDFARRRKDRWQWSLMLLVPEFVGPALAEQAIAEASAKKAPPPGLRLETLEEGRAVQTLHVGPYDEEGPLLAKLHSEFLPSQGLAETGRHHEIYLSDPRKTAPDRLKTLLRQPVRPLAGLREG